MATPEPGASSVWRAALEAALFALVIVGASLALDALARTQLRAHLATSAASTLGALVHGDTPWRWRLDDRADLVSGAAFGTQQTVIDGAGTQITGSGPAVEMGLHLDARVDLQRYPIVQFDLDAGSAAGFALVVRESLAGPLCASDAIATATGSSTPRVDVRELGWTCDGLRHDVPTRAAMLRLRFDLARDASARVANVRLSPITPLTSDELAAASPTPMRWSATARRIESSAPRATTNPPDRAWPLFSLALDGRVEQSMQAVDHLRAEHPAAIIVAEGDWAQVVARAEQWTRTDDGTFTALFAWVLVVGQALALLWIRLRPMAIARRQAVAELLAVLAVPLLLVIGGYIGNDLEPPVMAALAITLMFAASLLRGSAAPRQPASRMWKRGSAVAIATVLASVVVVLVLRDGSVALEWPPPLRVFRYLAWAAVQQLLVCVIVADRFERLSGSARWAIPAAAIVFALLHAPNAMLMQFTLLGGLVWVWNWQRHRALLANTVAHALSGLLLASQLPPDWLRSAEVSARYFVF